MTANWRTVRVFISSTFRDMQAERDHLVRFVFPRLREQLLPCRIHLVDVDLRWGVTSKQDATEVCREIINECRPRFLCMLGGRYGWVPPGKTRSITADEVHFGVLDRALSDRGFAHFYLRDDASTAAMVETNPGELREPQGSDNQNKLAELKQAIIAAGLNPFTYPAQWDNESRRLTGLKKFGDRVYDDLLGSMKSDPEVRDRFVMDTAAQLDEFDEENAAMEAFVEERSERFVLGSREAVLTELLAHANATVGNSYVCVTGAPGSGKSALLAHLSRHSTLNDQSSTLLIRHFVGASPGSTDVRRTLQRLCYELKVGCPDITADIPDDPEKLRVAFPDFLRQACEKKPVVILLDAVNQFDPASHSAGLHWLPEELPDNARVIISALDGPALEGLRRRPRKPREIELKALTPADGEAIIEQFRTRYRKRFEPEQRAALLAKIDAGTPLYLLAALEELRTLGTYEEITQRIAELPPTTHDLFAWILKRLENDPGFLDAAGNLIGAELVRDFVSRLSISRHGLSQRELAELIAPGDPKQAPPIPDDLFGNVAAMQRLLQPYLMRRGELLDFYHTQLREAVEGEYLDEEHKRLAAHRALAAFFRSKTDPAGNLTWDGQYARGLRDLPYHLVEGRQWNEAADLVSPAWRDAKQRAFGSDASFLDDLAFLAAAPVAGHLDHAAHVAVTILTATLREAGRDQLGATLRKMIEAGSYEEALRWAESAGLTVQACRAVLERTVAGKLTPSPEQLFRTARHLVETDGAERLAKWVADSHSQLCSRGYDVDALCLRLAADFAAHEAQQSDRSRKQITTLLEAWAPAVSAATLDQIWVFASRVVSAMSTASPAEMAGFCGELVSLAAYCPAGRHEALLEMINNRARQAGSLPFRDVAYRSGALRACGRALAHILNARQILTLSQGERLGFAGVLSDGRAERTALRMGAVQDFVRLGRWDEADYLARHFVQHGARVEALSLLLTHGPEDRIPTWEAEFLSALREAQVVAASGEGSGFATVFAVMSGAKDSLGEERLMTHSAIEMAKLNLSQADPDRAYLLIRVRYRLGVSDARREVERTSADHGIARQLTRPTSVTERLKEVAATWRSESQRQTLKDAVPARKPEDRDPASTREEIGLELSSDDETLRRAQEILRKVEKRYIAGPGNFLLIKKEFQAKDIWGEESGMEKAKACATQWYDMACGHVRNVLVDVAGEEESGVFGPSLEGIQRFEEVRQACKLAVQEGSQHAPGLIRCLSMAAQDLRSGGSTGRLGIVRARAKLVVSRLIGDQAAWELRRDVRSAFEMSRMNLYAHAFSFSQVAERLASLLVSEAGPLSTQHSGYILRLVDEAELPEPHASIIKARWLRRLSNATPAKQLLIQAHGALTPADGGQTHGREEVPSVLKDLHLMCLAREMAYLDAPVAFEWAKAINAPDMCCSTLIHALCEGHGWDEGAERDALLHALSYAVRNQLLSYEYALGRGALERIAEGMGYPEFPPLSWEEVVREREPSILSRLAGHVASSSTLKLDEFLDEAIAHAPADQRGLLLQSTARAPELTLDCAVRAARHLTSLPLDEFTRTMKALAQSVAARGAQHVCAAVASRIEKLSAFFQP